jgi:hypothetical protein
VKDAVHRDLAPVYIAQEELAEVYENIDGLVEDVSTRNQWIMNSRYKSRYDEVVTNLEKLKKKLERMNWEIDNNPEVYRLTDEMENYVNQTKTLTRIGSGLEEQILDLKNAA